MLNKIKNEEGLIIVFFGIMLVLSLIYFIIDKCMMDIIFFGVLIYYFCRFLIIRSR